MRQLRHAIAPILVLVALLSLAPVASAKQADTWVNSDEFSARCGDVGDTSPAGIYSLTKAAFANLGYSPVYAVSGAGFTTSAFLNHVYADYAVAVMSHGDVYRSGGAAFLQDPGTSRCNDYTVDKVTAAAIKAKTAGGPYNLVIMSTCYLGSTTHPEKGLENLMPEAFQIAKVKNASDREFYLGWVYEVFTSSMYRYEKQFFSYLNSTPNATLSQAFTWAKANPPNDGRGRYSAVDSANPFQPNWFGNPSYTGSANPPTCPTCPQ